MGRYTFEQAASKPYMHERSVVDRRWSLPVLPALGHSRAMGPFGTTQLCGRCQRNIGA